jgi:molybdopterin synthase catalytic subunit
VAIEIDVHYFAAARELCGKERERVALPTSPTSARAVLELLGRRHARLGALSARMRLAVNGEIVGGEHEVKGGDEIAVLPPVAGGSEPAPAPGDVLCAVRAEPLSVDEVLAAVRSAAAGGTALFIGTVRDHQDGAAVARLDYEAHPTLAEREMRRVLDEVAAAHQGVRLAALHRVGALAIGDLAVIVAASAAHRAEAFAACREAIELIKQRVPIWKKEWAPDGSAVWVNLKG